MIGTIPSIAARMSRESIPRGVAFSMTLRMGLEKPWIEGLRNGMIVLLRNPPATPALAKLVVTSAELLIASATVPPLFLVSLYSVNRGSASISTLKFSTVCIVFPTRLASFDSRPVRFERLESLASCRSKSEDCRPPLAMNSDQSGSFTILPAAMSFPTRTYSIRNSRSLKREWRSPSMKSRTMFFGEKKGFIDVIRRL